MRITSVKIKNFKTINETTIPLTDFTVIVGTNGSGKSSVLQALHWAIQSARNPTVETKKSDGSTLSLKDADYTPSPDYKHSSFGKPYGNFNDAPRMDVTLNAMDEDKNEISALIWIKAARNEGTTVHAPSNNLLIADIRNQGREFSSYIPGLAGIPLEEEKRSKRVVNRLAAAGDANTVLRNLLLLLKSEKSSLGNENALEDVEYYASKVMGEIKLTIEFQESKDFHILASF